MEYTIGLSSDGAMLGGEVKVNIDYYDLPDQGIWDVAETIRTTVDPQFSNGHNDTVIQYISKKVVVPIDNPS